MSFLSDGFSVLLDGVGSTVLSVFPDAVKQPVVNLFYFVLLGVALLGLLLFILV